MNITVYIHVYKDLNLEFRTIKRFSHNINNSVKRHVAHARIPFFHMWNNFTLLRSG